MTSFLTPDYCDELSQAEAVAEAVLLSSEVLSPFFADQHAHSSSECQRPLTV